MKTLLAVDGSDHSYEAVHALKFFAQAEQLTLLHVLNISKSVYPNMATRGDVEEYTAREQTMRADGERLLDRVQSLLPMHAGPATKHLRIGSPAEVVVSMAEKQKADLIVMGARGLGPIKERLFGSVSHDILTLAPCATLIVHGPVKAMKQILLPLQGSSDAEAAVRFLQLKPFHDAVEVTLLTVLPSTEPPGPGDAATAYTAYAEILEKQADSIRGAAEGLRALGYQAHGVAVAGTPAATILQEAITRCSDLILMGTRGRQGISRLVLGSVSHAVLHKMPCPVLAFH
ncbi:MAG TPA: universal stress protein [Nitrospiraceae bacterium]|nr:universal stress protein [Nitrospiraceae bacterium]